MKIRLTNKEIGELLGAESAEFPKYTTQLINLASQNAQATRPRIVGQMSELIQRFNGQKLNEWEDWYLTGHPDAIRTATNKIVEMIDRMKKAMSKIDRDLVEKWVRDLVIMKTFVGLRFQEAILKRVAEMRNTTYRLATPEEESAGIDGFIGDRSVSIKPATYKSKASLREDIREIMVYYEKRKDGLTIEVDEDWVPK